RVAGAQASPANVSANREKKKGRIAAALSLSGAWIGQPGSGSLLLVEELRVFRRALERGRGSIGFDGRGHGVEVAGADFALVLHGREAAFGGGELGLLQLHECRHVVA